VLLSSRESSLEYLPFFGSRSFIFGGLGNLYGNWTTTWDDSGSLVGDMEDSEVSSLADGVDIGSLWVKNFGCTLGFMYGHVLGYFLCGGNNLFVGAHNFKKILKSRRRGEDMCGCR